MAIKFSAAERSLGICKLDSGPGGTPSGPDCCCQGLVLFGSDSDYQKTFPSAPLDLLVFARAVDAFIRNKDVLRQVLEGEIAHIDDLSPFPKTHPANESHGNARLAQTEQAQCDCGPAQPRLAPHAGLTSCGT